MKNLTSSFKLQLNDLNNEYLEELSSFMMKEKIYCNQILLLNKIYDHCVTELNNTDAWELFLNFQ
ncbi:hypothetical protein HZS_2970, partial [Henneguya salminicola]